jgi:hypothetical protein
MRLRFVLLWFEQSLIMVRPRKHLWLMSVALPAVLVLAVTTELVAADAAQAKKPKWFVREGVEKHEKELVGTLHLKPMHETLSINFYLAKAEGTEEQKELADSCTSSSISGITITGGEPGKAEFGKVIISGCSESLSEPCTVASSSETVTLEHLKGELVYHNSGGGVAILFDPAEYSISLKCRFAKSCPRIGTEKIKTEFLPHEDSFAYAPLVEDGFSQLYLEYESESGGKSAEIHNSGTGLVEANRVGYEFSILQELEGAPAEDKEVKAE